MNDAATAFRRVGLPDKTWSYATERALFLAIDRNDFTTRFNCGYPNEYGPNNMAIIKHMAMNLIRQRT
ncbi:MAG: hypothetical protein Q7R40_10650 [Phaeospirillum sp.]|nr:hypothetical protein [Phaeospirillum sp.]